MIRNKKSSECIRYELRKREKPRRRWRMRFPIDINSVYVILKKWKNKR